MLAMHTEQYGLCIKQTLARFEIYMQMQSLVKSLDESVWQFISWDLFEQKASKHFK